VKGGGTSCRMVQAVRKGMVRADHPAAITSGWFAADTGSTFSVQGDARLYGH